MRRVIIHRSIGTNRADIGTEAYFHCWGSESNEDAGADTIAILEKDDGTVIECYPEQICFLEPHAISAKLAATPANIARACGMENEVEAAQEVSAMNPPKGWKIKPDDAPRKFGCLFWHPSDREWRFCDHRGWGEPLNAIIANPIEVTP